MEEIEEFTEIFKALSDPTRLKIVQMLSECTSGICHGGRLCVNALSQRLGVTQSAVSQHLRILKHAGLVCNEREGSFMHYSINPEAIKKCSGWINKIFDRQQKI